MARVFGSRCIQLATRMRVAACKYPQEEIFVFLVDISYTLWFRFHFRWIADLDAERKSIGSLVEPWITRSARAEPITGANLNP